MRCKYFAQKVVKVSFSWNFHTELEESSIRERKAEKSRFQDKKATKIQRKSCSWIEIYITYRIEVRPNVPVRIPSHSWQRWCQAVPWSPLHYCPKLVPGKKKNEIEKLSLVKVKPPSVVLLHGIISLYSYFEKIWIFAPLRKLIFFPLAQIYSEKLFTPTSNVLPFKFKCLTV